jgi:predicted enzyme related to lactoylglutathione lyase
MAASSSGKLFWYDLQTSDVAAADIFYSAVVGWTVTCIPM